MARTENVAGPAAAQRDHKRRISRRARRDRYWRYRHIYGRGSARQFAISLALAGVAIFGAMAWDYLTAPVGEDRQGPVALCHGLPLRSCVIDGDTGRDKGKKWRLISIDAPELAEPACENEKRLALAARDRLRELLADGYSIRPNGRDDPNGRTLVDITLPDGRGVGRILITEGLAQPWPNRGNIWCRGSIDARLPTYR